MANSPIGSPPDSPHQNIRIPIPSPAKGSLVTKSILAVTIFFFALQFFSSQVFGIDYPITLGAKVNSAIRAGQFWRLITPVLLHANLIHIGFNMYALHAIGSGLEQRYGRLRFLLLYLVSALGGNVLSFLLSPNPSVGASTAVFGLVAAQGVFIYRNRFLFGGQSRALLGNIITIIVINLILGLSPGIDNWGHLGGLIAGLSFSWFAGPYLKIEGLYPDLTISDKNHKQRAYQVAAAITTFFLVLVIIGLR